MDKKNESRKAVRAARLRKQRARRAILTLCLMLAVAVVSVGGTIAWLTDDTDPVVNTFTPSDIAITLTETWNTDTDNDEKADAWKAQMIPSKEYTKDPVVAVDGTVTDVDVYLFVKFEETGDPSTYLTYTSTLTEDNGWKLVEGTTNVWYRVVKTTDTTKSWNLLEGNKITVKNTVTKENMSVAAAASLKYTAYAIQTEGFTSVAAAWAEVNPDTTTNN